MRARLSAHVTPLICSVVLLGGGDPQPVPPVPEGVRFPESSLPPQPASVLTGDRLYVVSADVDGFLLVHPPGLVTVSQDAGPLKIRGRFVGGPDKAETRTFMGKTVFVVEAIGAGRVYIDFVSVGAKTPADVVSRTVDVDVGGGARPPPDPPPGPPNPPSPPSPTADPELVKKYQDALARDVTAGGGDKATALKLAQSYLDTADTLVKETDGSPTRTVKTAGDLYTLAFTTSVSAGVPRLPWLQYVRGVTGTVVGTPTGGTLVTDATRPGYVAVFRKCGSALKEASR